VVHATLDLVDEGYFDNTPVYAVPPGHYFMLGDNRDNSADSRVLSQVGYVPFENLVGRADLIVFSSDRESRTNGFSVRFERIGMVVR
jgi:signal peptidase I